MRRITVALIAALTVISLPAIAVDQTDKVRANDGEKNDYSIFTSVGWDF